MIEIQQKQNKKMKSQYQDIRRSGMVKLRASIYKQEQLIQHAEKRREILTEWIKSQYAYLQDLQVIQNKIRKTFREAKLISAEHDEMFFSNLMSMMDLSDNFRVFLQVVTSEWSPRSLLLGEKIQTFSKLFIVYIQYCKNVMKGVQMIKQLKKCQALDKLKAQLKQDIESYLIIPFERAARHKYFLQEYLKLLPSQHEDCLEIEKALKNYDRVIGEEKNSVSEEEKSQAATIIYLQKNFGGIISRSSQRTYIKKYICTISNAKCELYIFSDMVIILKKNVFLRWELRNRIILDYTSFVKRKHLKYYQKYIYLCGRNQSTHFGFEEKEMYEDAVKILQKLIQDHQDKFNQFLNSPEKDKQKLRQIQNCDNQVLFLDNKIAKMQIVVQNTIKEDGQVYYFTAFKIVEPLKLNQLLVLTHQQMEQIEKIIVENYPTIQIPSLSQWPEQIGIYDILKNRTQIIQYRSFMYEEFINYFFRHQEFGQKWLEVAEVLGINTYFFSFACNINFECRCCICAEIQQQSSLKKLINQNQMMRKSKKVVKSKLIWVGQEKFISKSGNDLSENTSIRSLHYFKLMENIRKCPLPQNADFYEKIISLESKMGHIQYPLLDPEQNQKPLKELMSLRIVIVSHEEELIEIRMTEDTYVRSIIEEVGAKNSLELVYDWGLFLDIDGVLLQIPPDEKILRFGQKWKVEIAFKIEKEMDEEYLLSSKCKKEDTPTGKNKLFFKKWLYLQINYELECCMSNRQRFGFLINLIHHRLKNGEIQLNTEEIKGICGLYMLKNTFEKVKHYDSAESMEIQLLKDILPQKKWQLLKKADFISSLFESVKKWYQQLNMIQNKRNIMVNICQKILNTLKNNKSWLSRSFTLTSYKGSSKNDVSISINTRSLVVYNRESQAVVFELDIMKIKYRVTTFSLFIEGSHKEYRYDGVQAADIKRMIQTYRIYRMIV